MDEDTALETIAALLDSLEVWNGDGRLIDHIGVPQADLHAALKAVAYEPSNGMIAEVLIEKAFMAFKPHLLQFQQTLCESGKGAHEPIVTALLRLRDHFDDFSPTLTGWCTHLAVPSMALLFPVHVRCHILQADLLSGQAPPGKPELIAFLRQHCRQLLRDGDNCTASSSPRASIGGSQATFPGPDAASTVRLSGQLARKSATQCDAVFAALHRLTLSGVTELKSLWHGLLEEAIVDRVSDAVEDDVYSEYKLTTLLHWEETVITSFVHMALPSAEVGPLMNVLSTSSSSPSHGAGLGGFDAFARSEKESWCVEMRQKLLCCYTRRRIGPLWDILAEYPDSIPALVDVRYCLEASQEDALKDELISNLKSLLAARLHRAGTRTEDILAMLIKAIHSLGVLLSRNEQNTVILTVVGDTLAHLHKRKDSVAAIVQVITQWTSESDMAPGDLPLAESGLPATASVAATFGGAPAPPVAVAADPHRGGAQEGGGDDVGDIADSLRSGARGRPDILRVLLSAIPLKSLVQEYQRVLAQQLLSKGMSQFDTTPEEEVLERLKCTFGEEPLAQCVVMIRDIQMSRRLTQQLREMRGPVSHTQGGTTRPLPAPLTAPEELSVDVLSLTAWPPLPRAPASSSVTPSATEASWVGTPSPDTFTPHPALQGEMDRVAELYKQLKANRRLVWLLPESRVKLDVLQHDPTRGGTADGGVVPVEFELSIFVASLALFLRELTSHDRRNDGAATLAVPLATLASRVHVTVEQALPQVQLWCPKLFILNTAAPTGPTVALQTNVVHSDVLAFEEADEATSQKEEPVGFPPEQLKLYERLVKTMIKTQGPKTANEVFNSIKIVGSFSGTLADAKKLLQHFVNTGVLALNDAKSYVLP